MPDKAGSEAMDQQLIIDPAERILVTGANGFIGSRVVEALVRRGFTNLCCFVRPSSNVSRLREVLAALPERCVDVVAGNLLSPEDARRAARGARVIFHLAAGVEKTFAGCFLNSVVTTRNLLDAAVEAGCLRRFVNISSFSVYSNWNLRRGALLDETCETETQPFERSEPYMYAKLKQDELVFEYARNHGLNYVILRPGAVYGPGASQLTARVGIDTFGVFLHLGGGNRLPLTYVDNCADAIVSAGLSPGADGEVFNVVDDDLPTSRQFLKLFRQNVKPIRAWPVPYPVFYAFCWLWGKYSRWSKGQLPPVFNPRRCAAYWKGNRYTNRKLKERVGWQPAIPYAVGASRYFESLRRTQQKCSA
jgi:nucleoside-diphosphate-sugar epimerase